MRILPQRTRLVVMLLYFALLVGLSMIAFDRPFPPQDAKGLWFYAGLFAFLTGSQIEAPKFSTPGQALIFSIIALVATLGYGFPTRTNFDQISYSAWFVALGVLALTASSAAISILIKAAPVTSTRGKLSKSGYTLGTYLGRPQVVTSFVFLFAVLAYHRADTLEALKLTIGWSMLVFARPIENLLLLWERLQGIWDSSSPPSVLGTVIAHGVPGIVTVRHDGGAVVETGTPLLLMGDDGLPNIAIAADYVGIADGVWLRAIQLRVSPPLRARLPKTKSEPLSCSVLSDTSVADLHIDDDTLQRRKNLIGLVSAGSDTRNLKFEVVRSDIELEEGRLLETRIAGKMVTYQLLDGLTRDAILQQKNTRGFVEGEARKIGKWSGDKKRFESVRWVPEPNSPVFLVDNSSSQAPKEAIGTFPGTSYPVRVNPSDLVTHNTAILGILGVGKTYLSLELVERMILSGIRVISLDLTNQYESELSPYIDEKLQDRVHSHLAGLGKEGVRNFQKNVEDGGSIKEFRKEVDILLQWFLDPARNCKLLVVNPNAFEVWRQDSKIFGSEASMATLTAAEITRVFAEAALTACQKLGVTTEARCSLVFEEAHSLVPEWNAVANDGDKGASNGSARAILQGRKFGLGCLIVTQRTASVTKTILNQCNTVFAMRVFDATGMEFLANYIGDDYVKILSGLEDRHAVVFGKASSCADPVLVRVNDREAFLSLNRLPLEEVQAPVRIVPQHLPPDLNVAEANDDLTTELL